MVQEDSGTTPAKGKERKLNKENENNIASPSGDNGDARPRFTCSHFEISDEYFLELLQDYPGLTEGTLTMEIKKARDWLDDNPKRHKRTAKGFLKNPKIFLRNWLSKVVVDPARMDQTEEAANQRKPDPKCEICQGKGLENFEENGVKYSRQCACLGRKNG